MGKGLAQGGVRAQAYPREENENTPSLCDGVFLLVRPEGFEPPTF